MRLRCGVLNCKGLKENSKKMMQYLFQICLYRFINLLNQNLIINTVLYIDSSAITRFRVSEIRTVINLHETAFLNSRNRILESSFVVFAR